MFTTLSIFHPARSSAESIRELRHPYPFAERQRGSRLIGYMEFKVGTSDERIAHILIRRADN
jgi:hypothetical protein